MLKELFIYPLMELEIWSSEIQSIVISLPIEAPDIHRFQEPYAFSFLFLRLDTNVTKFKKCMRKTVIVEIV